MLALAEATGELNAASASHAEVPALCRDARNRGLCPATSCDREADTRTSFRSEAATAPAAGSCCPDPGRIPGPSAESGVGVDGVAEWDSGSGSENVDTEAVQVRDVLAASEGSVGESGVGAASSTVVVHGSAL